jgi:hypothetical protein
MATTMTSLIVPMIRIPSISIRRLTNLLVIYILIVLTNLGHYGVIPNFGVVKQSSSFLCVVKILQLWDHNPLQI